MHPDTPILVGVAAVQQRVDDPAIAREPLELMIAALEGAADDAGNRDLLRMATSIRAPRGFWSYSDPCRLIAERFAATARTEVGEIGVLQTTFFGRAARDIAAGRDEVVLLTGGEARYRSRRAHKSGVSEYYTPQDPAVVPDKVLRPARDVLHDLEIARGLGMPVTQYSMIENALRAADGISVAAHRDEVAALYARFAAVAADNPDAWNRSRPDAAAIRGDAGGSRMLAFPYTALHTSQWNVDQAAGFVMTSVAKARSLGIAEERWIYPHAVVDSNLMLALSERRDPQRCFGFAEAAKRIEERTGLAVGQADHLELYSCFPSAVRLQMREMGVAADRAVTVTGGMAFAGGPLNNFAFQALAKMAGILRGDPGSTGVVTAVSGILTKQGVSLWSTEAPAAAFHFGDVSEETARDSASVEVVDEAQGLATVVTYTVLNPGDEGVLVALVDMDAGPRTIVATADAELVQRATGDDELCGARVRVGGPDQLAPA